MPNRAFLAAVLSTCAALAQQVPLATVVSGQITDVLGDGVPAAQVWVTGEDGAVLGRAVADGEGLFLVRKLPDGTRLVLHARADGRVETSVDIDVGGQLRVATLMLEQGVPLHGRVTRPDGTRIAGAAVIVSAPLDVEQQRPRWRAETTTDAEGRYAFAAVPMPQVELAAWAEGCALVSQPVATTREAVGDLLLPPGPASPRRVQLAGLPAGAKAMITVLDIDPRADNRQELPLPLRSAAVAADGTASLWPLPFAHQVQCEVPGGRTRPERIRCAGGSTEALLFTAVAPPVPTSTMVTGIVVDELGHGLAGVHVRGGALDRPGATEIASGADGRFTLTVPVRAGVYCQLGLAPGPRRLGDPRAALAPDGITWLSFAADPAQVVKLHTMPAGAIRGIARDDTGAPMRCARVQLCRYVPTAKGGRGTALVLNSATDAAGRVDVGGLPAGEYRVIVAGERCIGSADVVLRDGGAADFGQLALTRLGSIEGVVCDERGQALPGAWLQFHWQPQRRPGGVSPPPIGVPSVARTDRDGRFRIHLRAAGTWAVVVRTLGTPPLGATARVEVAEGETSTIDLAVGR